MRVFKEVQRFTQLWIIILMAVSSILPFTLIIQNYQKKSNSNLSELTATLVFVTLVHGIVFLFKLKTRIDEKGIHYKFFPFHFSFKLISWEEIEKVYLRTYKPIAEYGGWGLKGGWSSSKGKAINVSGHIGIQLELKNGKRLLIGTQKKDQVAQIILKHKNKKYE